MVSHMQLSRNYRIVDSWALWQGHYVYSLSDTAVDAGKLLEALGWVAGRQQGKTNSVKMRRLEDSHGRDAWETLSHDCNTAISIYVMINVRTPTLDTHTDGYICIYCIYIYIYIYRNVFYKVTYLRYFTCTYISVSISISISLYLHG